MLLLYVLNLTFILSVRANTKCYIIITFGLVHNFYGQVKSFTLNKSTFQTALTNASVPFPYRITRFLPCFGMFLEKFHVSRLMAIKRSVCGH